MKQTDDVITTPYLEFNKEHWAELYKSAPVTLTDNDILKLKSINKELYTDNVIKSHLPLSYLLNCYISSKLSRQSVLEKFLDINEIQVPYIIGIAGSVSVGKSTMACLLQALLTHWTKHRKVDLITTDSFLYPNQLLQDRNIMKKKGFPQSYDMCKLVNFISKIKSGARNVIVSVYSHITYDIVPEKIQVIDQPDILILEGVNILQNHMQHPSNYHHVCISDFIDFSIYIDATYALLKKWFIDRFLKFCQEGFLDPDSYFHHYSKSSKEEIINIAGLIWEEINRLNLEENILPTKERANLIITKDQNHSIKNIRLRK
ncbi:Pantothenate kinase [Candidatus Hartigia pinicola]|nr:Pantothenate kinase [Candidatus Hartigia pinicola]